MELLDGRSGTPHIDGEKLGVMNLGLGGADGYLYEYGEKASASVVDSNHVTIGTFAGQLPSNGRRVICQVPETVTVESGTQGQSRRDLVVVRQTSSTVGDSTTEGAALTVVRGTPVSSGTPADPETLDTDLVLWRLLISNTTLGTPVSMARVLKPLADVWDSVSQKVVTLDMRKVTTDPTFTARGIVVGGSFAVVYVYWINAGEFFLKAWSQGTTLCWMPGWKWVGEQWGLFTDSMGGSTSRLLYGLNDQLRYRVTADTTTLKQTWHCGFLAGPVARA